MTVKVLDGAKSPLNGAKFGDEKSIAMQEVPFTPGYDLRVDPASAGFGAVNAALGLTLPTTVGAVARVNADCPCGDEVNGQENSIIALCLGPDWWFITGNVDVEALIAPLRDTHHLSIVDVSAQRTKIELWGPNSKEVLEHVWEQDLREKNFGIDKCTQGIMFHTPVILWHCCENCYIVLARSSFATHLWAALTDATVEYL